jgi:cell division protein FtsZ
MNCRICVVGIGDGGCKIVDCVASLAPVGLPTVAINTDSRSLLESRATTKIEIGSGRTNGLGTSGDANLGKLAAEDDIEMIRNLFSEIDLVIVVAGLGGGTGDGASQVVLRAARDAGSMTLCVATLPFEFEGGRRRMQAEKSVALLGEIADAIVAIANDKLAELVGGGGVAETYQKTDNILGASIYAIAKLITDPEYINVDFSELRRMITEGGACVFGYGHGTGNDKGAEAVKSLFGSALVESGAVAESSKAVLVSIVGGKDLTVKELRHIREALTSKLRSDCHISLGTVIDEHWNGEISMVMIASEQRPVRHESALAPASAARERTQPVKSDQDAKRRRSGQTQLSFEPPVKGRFKDAVPTIMDGEDFDIPTYVRRGIIIEK